MIRTAGVESRIRPPKDSIAAESALMSVSLPPSIYPSSSSNSDFRDRPTRLTRVQIQAAEMFSAYSWNLSFNNGFPRRHYTSEPPHRVIHSPADWVSNESQRSRWVEIKASIA